MSWRELITDLYETRAEETGIAGKPAFHPAASADAIAQAEARLDAQLPATLRSLLLETNGVMEMIQVGDGDWIESMWLLWTVEEIVDRNASYREATDAGTYHRDFRTLVFFVDVGCDGMLFGFPVAEDRTCRPSVCVWRPIDDELDEVAPSLEEFLRGGWTV